MFQHENSYIRIFLDDMIPMGWHMHNDIRIMYNIHGEATIYSEDSTIWLAKGMFAVINPNELHWRFSENNDSRILIVSFDVERLYSNYPSLVNKKFHIDNKASGYIRVFKRFFFMFIKKVIDEDGDSVIHISHMAEMLLDFLDRYFSVKTDALRQDEMHDAVQAANDYILGHYSKPINLESISYDVGLNPQYLSRQFTKRFGLTISQQISRVRVLKSINELVYSATPINIIAEEYGFTTSGSYYRAFREYYDVTPSEYRKIMVENTSNCVFRNTDSLQKLYEDIQSYNFSPSYAATTEYKEKIRININEEVTNIDSPSNKMCLSVRLDDSLWETWRLCFHTLCTNAHIKSCCCTDVLAEDLKLFNEKTDKLEFDLFDRALSFFLSFKLKTIVCFDTIPAHLMSLFENDHAAFLKKWSEIIVEIVDHLKTNLTSEDYKLIRFSIWNEPMNYIMLGKTIDDFFDFFMATFNAIRSVDNMCKIGGCNFFIGNVSTPIASKFFQKVRKYSLKFDFLTVYLCGGNLHHCCDQVVNSSECLNFIHSQYTAEMVSTLRKEVENQNVTIIFMSDAYSLSKCFPQDDTVLTGCFLAKNIIDSLFDQKKYYSVKTPYTRNTYRLCGNLYLLDSLDICRQPFCSVIRNVFYLLNKLGSHLIIREKNCLVTRGDDGKISVLYYNFHNVSNQINFDEYFMEWKNNIVFCFEGLSGIHRVVSYRLSSDQGTLYKTWQQLGSPKSEISKDILPFLKSKSIPAVRVKNNDFSTNSSLSIVVEPFEVVLIEIE